MSPTACRTAATAAADLLATDLARWRAGILPTLASAERHQRLLS